MRRRKEHLVEKRDGRREYVRATKLARSIHMALREVGVDEDWRALELASVVLEALREKRRAGAQSGNPAANAAGNAAGAAVTADVEAQMLTTAELSDAVQHLLVVTGQPAAAASYGAVSAERARRRQTIATMLPPPGSDRVTMDRLGGRFAGEG